MPEVTKIESILKKQPDEPLTYVRGTITKLWDPKSGTSANGKEWKLQGGALSDATGECKLLFSSHADVPKSFIGQEVLLSAHHGDKGWSGLYVYEDDYKGVKSKGVKITKTGSVDLYKEETEGERPKEVAKPSVPMPEPEDSGGIVKQAKQLCHQARGAMAICLHEAVALRFAYEAEFDRKLSDEHFSKIASQFYMMLERKGLVCKFPVAPIEPPKKELPKEQIDEILFGMEPF